MLIPRLGPSHKSPSHESLAPIPRHYPGSPPCSRSLAPIPQAAGLVPPRDKCQRPIQRHRQVSGTYPGAAIIGSADSAAVLYDDRRDGDRSYPVAVTHDQDGSSVRCVGVRMWNHPNRTRPDGA
jgi:hypothetical protein